MTSSAMSSYWNVELSKKKYTSISVKWCITYSLNKSINMIRRRIEYVWVHFVVIHNIIMIMRLYVKISLNWWQLKVPSFVGRWGWIDSYVNTWRLWEHNYNNNNNDDDDVDDDVDDSETVNTTNDDQFLLIWSSDQHHRKLYHTNSHNLSLIFTQQRQYHHLTSHESIIRIMMWRWQRLLK